MNWMKWSHKAFQLDALQLHWKATRTMCSNCGDEEDNEDGASNWKDSLDGDGDWTAMLQAAVTMLLKKWMKMKAQRACLLPLVVRTERTHETYSST